MHYVCPRRGHEVKFKKRESFPSYGDQFPSYTIEHHYGIPADYEQAYKWLTLTKDALPPGPDATLAHRYRDALTQNMTPGQLFHAQQLVQEWRPTVALQGQT